VKNLILLSVLFALLLSFTGMSGCLSASESSFGIYLVDSGELVLSGEHIQAYYQDTHVLELNEAGIERWNSYLTYDDIPKLKETLYLRDFVVKVNGEEIYRGQFWSYTSSMMYGGYVILESLFKLDEDNHTIWIEFSYPGSTDAAIDMRNDSRIIEFFDDSGILR
jgi:hypothetical protein